MNEGGGLKSVTRRFMGHFVGGQVSEFLVDER
jgi:hypothetical protein